MAAGDDHVSSYKRNRERNSSLPSDMTTMRIAVAGTGGLARLIAQRIDEDTSHHVVFLSRSPQPALTALGFQVAVVDYQDAASLQYALRGVDTVVSTVSGANQVELIRAAVAVHVRRFAPAEFEGRLRPETVSSASDRLKLETRNLLQLHANRIQSTVFVCGILYERFHPRGLEGLAIGQSSGLSRRGDYIMDCLNMSGQVPVYDVNGGTDVWICMTAARDVAKFVTKALDMPSWPAELCMRGQRYNVMRLVQRIQEMRNRPLSGAIQWHTPVSLQAELQAATRHRNTTRQLQLSALLRTALGHYDFEHANLNQRFRDVVPVRFDEWFQTMWDPIP